MKAVVVFLAVSVAAALAVVGGGGGDMPACAEVSGKMREFTKSMMGKMKKFHEECIQYNEDREFLRSLMRMIQRASKRMFSKAYGKCRRRNSRMWRANKACQDYAELNIEETIDNYNIAHANFTTTRNSSKGCQPGKTWFKPMLVNGTKVDKEFLVRHHPRIQPCNNLTLGIDKLHSRQPPNLTARPSMFTYNVTFSDMCMGMMSRMVKIRSINCNATEVVYQMEGMKDICPEHDMCKPADFIMSKIEQLKGLISG